MGTGKTTVGHLCADMLGRPFVDTDDVAGTLAGLPVPEFIAAHGLPAFREIESRAVVDVCASPVPLVVACGGGTPIDADNRRRLRATGLVVWLRAPVEVLVGRVAGDGRDRPLLAGDPQGALTRLGAAREAAYEAAAHACVDTAGCAPEEVAAAVVSLFEGAAP
ncbi:MAG: shikimate kinase [Actinomycetota bacterium]